MNHPNFFIIGAPKCGTTALSEYLRSHPDIYFCWPKEPDYFAEDLGDYRRVRSLDEYRGLFNGVAPGQTAIGEGSVWYFHSAVAASNVYSFNKNAKIIVMLRNPKEFVQSLHAQLLGNCFESETDLATAWRLQPSRREGHNVPATCRVPMFLQYSELGKFSTPMRRLLSIFPRNQVKIILHDDLKRSTENVYRETLDFLQVRDDGRSDFSEVNARRRTKSKLFAKLIHHPPPIVRFAEKKARRILNGIGVHEFPLWHRILDLNTAVVPRSERTELDPALAEMMDLEFSTDIDELAHLIGRDLTSWKRAVSS